MTDEELRRELLAAFEAEYRDHLQAIRATLDAGAVAGSALRDVFRRAHSLKGAARAVDLPEVEEIAHGLETLLHQAIERGEGLAEAAIVEVRRGLDGIEGRMRGPAALEPAPVDPARPAGPETAEPALRVPAPEIDRLGGTLYALSDAMQQQEQARSGLAEAEAELRALVRLWDGLELGRGTARPAGAVEFEQRLRQLSRRLGVKLRNRRGLDWQLDQAVASLREQVERVALVSADSVFDPLAAMARELAREAGGEVAVRFEGLALRAERRVLQALRDPAIQLLRNAIGHGMRPGDVPGQVPTITLSLAQRAGRLELAVADEGVGPDLVRIERRARAQGLLPRDGPAPDERKLLALVFEPGFSTAAEIDRLSGRGMGLAIVAEAAARLQGRVAMAARREADGRILGTEVRISVPLPARRQTLLLVEAAGHLFALPGSAIVRLLRVPAHRVERRGNDPVLRQDRDRDLLPLGALGRLAGGVDPMQADATAADLSVAVLEADGRRCGVVVEHLHDVRTLVVRTADVVGLDRALVAGITLAERNRPVPVLDPGALVAALLAPSRPAMAAAPAAPAARSRPTILVVDDSITTRTLEKTILQAQGYRVLIAVDGVEALTVLRTAEWTIDVVVADVEMPRLDGFGLLAAMRADPALAQVPTILMTSRNQEADIRRGLALGARAYVAKQDFDQGRLLATIGQLLP